MPRSGSEAVPGRKLLLVDGHSMAFRAFFALPAENFSTATGQYTNAIYGFVSMFVNLLRDEDPSHVAVSFDMTQPTLRLAEYAEYKAGRAATPPEFKGQIALLQDVLRAMNVTIVPANGYEADDVLATLSKMADDAGWSVVVSSGDRDAIQLVDDATTLLYPVRGVSDLVRYDPAAVEEKYLVPPAQYPELAALVGESADNLPGVPGVGPKTAAKWLRLYGGLDGVVERAGEIKGKAGQSLRDHLADVLRNRRLNALVRDLDLGVGLDDLERRPIDHEAVDSLFDVLEFSRLRERVFALDGAADDPAGADEAPLEVREVDGPGLVAWLRASTAPVALDAVGEWAQGTGDVRALALARRAGGGAVEAVFASLVELDPESDAALAAWLADPGAAKVVHAAKGPQWAFLARDIALAGIVDDPGLSAYLINPDQRSYDLADLAQRHLGRTLETGEPSGQGQLDLGVDDREPELAGQRAATALDLSETLAPTLAEHNATGLLHDLELPLSTVLARMEHTGIAVDEAILRDLEDEFSGQASRAAEAAWAAIGGERINLGSPKQLQKVLFEDLGMPKTRATKTGYTTDAEALAELFRKTEHPFLANLLAHRDATKLKQTVEGLRRSVSDDGRIHTTFQQTVAATGRLSSINPNLQNIPARTAEGVRIRSAFVVGRGFETLLSADYSQIEMRIMAHVSGDAGLIEAFRTGEDLHRYVGSKVYGVAPEDVTPQMRSHVKAMSYGLAYGLSAFGLSRQLNIPVTEAQALMDDYFERFGGVRDYLHGVVERARKTGYTETLLGRRRYLPDLTSSNRQRRAMAERAALNAPIQGSAADLIKLAMLHVQARIDDAGLASRLLLQVHDELIVEVAPGERERVETVLREEMGRAAELSVPLTVAVGSGASWQDAAH